MVLGSDAPAATTACGKHEEKRDRNQARTNYERREFEGVEYPSRWWLPGVNGTTDSSPEKQVLRVIEEER